jgi:DNA-binding Lrp family transcriptional regulator
VRQIPEVEECHMIASSFDYLLKVRTPDIRRYRIVLGEKISSLPHVASTSTFVAMETILRIGKVEGFQIGATASQCATPVARARNRRTGQHP